MAFLAGIVFIVLIWFAVYGALWTVWVLFHFIGRLIFGVKSKSE